MTSPYLRYCFGVRDNRNAAENSLREYGDDVSFSKIVMKPSNEYVGRIYVTDSLNRTGSREVDSHTPL